MGKTAIIGANGQIGRRLIERLRAQGHPVRALVRREDQRADLEAAGVEAVLGDLEGDFEAVLDGCDAVVFSAGSGAHTGADKTLLVDLWGAVKVIRACQRRGPKRFLMVSARRVDDPDSGPQGMRPYRVAKRVADDYLLASGLDHTILRPGKLVNEPGTGRYATAPRSDAPEDASIPREDVAEALAHCLAHPETIGRVTELYRGDRPLADVFA